MASHYVEVNPVLFNSFKMLAARASGVPSVLYNPFGPKIVLDQDWILSRINNPIEKVNRTERDPLLLWKGVGEGFRLYKSSWYYIKFFEEEG